MKHDSREFQIADMLTEASEPPTFVNLRIMIVGEGSKRRKIYLSSIMRKR